MTTSLKNGEWALSLSLALIFRRGTVMASWSLVILAVEIPALAVCGIWGSLTMIGMIEEINRMRPGTGHISEMGFYPTKNLKIWKEHRRLYPKGRLRAHFIMLVASGVTFLLMGASALGFF